MTNTNNKYCKVIQYYKNMSMAQIKCQNATFYMGLNTNSSFTNKSLCDRYESDPIRSGYFFNDLTSRPILVLLLDRNGAKRPFIYMQWPGI